MPPGLNVNYQRQRVGAFARAEPRWILITRPECRIYQLVSDDIVFMQLADGACFGRRLPSSEWRFHRDIYGHRADSRRSCIAIRRTNGAGCHGAESGLSLHGGRGPGFDIRCAH